MDTVLDTGFIEEMKSKLVEMKQEILAHLTQETEQMLELTSANEQKDIVDIATTDIDKNMLTALSQQELKRLNLIDSALARIRDGQYGICLKTGKPIPEERLRAIPYALYTIDAQNALERRNR